VSNDVDLTLPFVSFAIERLIEQQHCWIYSFVSLRMTPATTIEVSITMITRVNERCIDWELASMLCQTPLLRQSVFETYWSIELD
jgi:hypothetical protein